MTTTNRIDHSTHTWHDRTPAGRAECRASRDAVARGQRRVLPEAQGHTIVTAPGPYLHLDATGSGRNRKVWMSEGFHKGFHKRFHGQYQWSKVGA